jgi:hypothetical protein
MKRFFHAAFSAVALALLLAGCAAMRQFPTQNPQAKLLTGQMLYSSPKRSFVGDFTARVSESDFQLDVAKGPGSLFFVRESGGTLARVEAMGHSWQGGPRFAPGILRSWLALGDVLAGKNVPNARVTRSGDQLTAEFPATRERFVFHFSSPAS